MPRLSLDFIEKKMIEIRDEYDALPNKPIPSPVALLKFLALADTIAAHIGDSASPTKASTPQEPIIKSICDEVVSEESKTGVDNAV